MVNFGEVRRAKLAKSLSLSPRWCPWDLFRTFKVCSDAEERERERERECGAESNGKLPHLFIPNRTAALVHEFAVEGLPLGRTAALVPEFVTIDLPMSRTL